jgi:predicted HicB family RNase H-like nuclease
MVEIKRKKSSKTHNPQLAEVIADAKKETPVSLHVQIPEGLMKRLRIHAIEQKKSLRDVIVGMLEKNV